MRNLAKRILSLIVVAVVMITSLPFSVIAETAENIDNKGMTIDLSKTDESIDEVINNIQGLNALANGEKENAHQHGSSEKHTHTVDAQEAITDSESNSFEDGIFDIVVEETVEQEVDVKLESTTTTESPATDFEYSIKNGDVTIKDYIGSATEVVIPEKIEGYPVTSIGNYAFRYCSLLASIIIPNSVTSIGNSAFEGCYSLTSIIIPDSVTSIGEDAFYSCLYLTNVTIPDSVTWVGLNAFGQCLSMTGIEVSPNNQYYSSEDGVLFNKKKTELICCPGGKKGQYVISDSVTSVWKYAFFACYHLTGVTIPNSVTSIGYYAFENCDSLTSVTIPDSVKTIEEYTFAFCSSLTSVIIENGVSSIENHAFYTCESLTNVIIGNSVTSIGYNAFAYCPSLESVTIPDSVTSLEGGAFAYCSSLTNVTIGNGVTSIGFDAFNKCESLTSITIPNNVTNIEKSAFAYCSSLTRVTMGNGINSIGESAFNKCISLTKVTIPGGVTSVGDNAFCGCSSLISIEVSNNNKYYSSEDGVLFNKEKTELIRCPEGKEGHYVISDTVTCIREKSFYDCDKITRLTIGNGVKNIVSYTFYDCDSLVSLTLSRSIVNIEYDAFSRYGKSIKHIFYTGSEAEWNNISISTGANLGSAVVHYEVVPGNEYEVKVQNATCTSHKNTAYCCAFCEKTIFEFEEPNSAIGHHYVDGICEHCNIEEGRLWNYKISKGNAYITEGESSVKEVTIPPEIEGFPVKGIEWFAFQDCTELTKVTILANINYISLQAFCGCSKLESIYIPNSVSAIESNAFAKCAALKNVYYSGTEDEWNNINIKNGNDELLNANSYVNYVPGDIPEDDTTSDDLEAPATDFEYSFKYSKVTINKYIGTATEVVIPSEIEGCPVTSIGNSAFYGCHSLVSIRIPDGVTSIGNSAFYGCHSLVSIRIPDGVTSIGNSSFRYCNLLTEINIPDGVTSIEYYAFSDCSALTSITIPDSVTSIEYYAFESCSALKKITIPENVTSIGEGAFKYCSTLTSITIPENVTSIGALAFCSCDSLTRITIPEGVTSIDYRAFFECKSLTDVYYTGTEAEWDAIEIAANNDSLNNATIHFNYVPGALPEEITPLEGSDVVVDAEKATVSGIAAQSKPADVIAQFEGSDNIQIVGKDGKALADDALVGTGCKVQLIENGEVKDEVTVVIKGEIDGNGIIDSDDAIYMLRNTLFPDVFPVVVDDDIDGNGVYDSDDAIYLLRYTLFPDVFPLK